MIDPLTRSRWFDPSGAFDDPVTVIVVSMIAGLLLVSGVAVLVMGRGSNSELTREIRVRTLSWLVIAPAVVVPILLGALWAAMLLLALSLLMYREFARATGLFRHRLISLIVIVCTVLVSFAVVDNWYGLFVAMGPISLVLIAMVSVTRDEPDGFIQRVALGSFAFLLFGTGVGHLGYFTNSADYRPILLVIIFCAQINDVAAFCAGKILGKRKLAPRTSPNKTYAGSIGAILVTTPIAAWLVAPLLSGTRGDSLVVFVMFGVIVSVGGQFGDLFLSSIKRDLGIKDMGVTIPGHGGFLDRFDSLIIVGPAAFHYLGYFMGVGLDQPIRVLSGSG